MRHIRTTDHNVKDARFRCRVAYSNKARPTFCGAEPAEGDVSRADARHLLGQAYVRPQWSADFCPDCVRLLSFDPMSISR